MANGDATAEPNALRQIGHEMGVETRGIVAGIDVHIDIDVESPCKLEDPVDLSRVIDVVVGRCADHMCAHLQSLDEGGIGGGRRRQTFLREDADFEIDRPGIVLGQHLQRLDALYADGCIDLGVGAYARRSVLDAAFERRLSARIDVFDRERRFDRLHPTHVVWLAATRLRSAAVDDARLVQMDVGLDQTCAAESAFGIVRWASD